MIQDIGEHIYHVEYTKRREPADSDYFVAVRGRTLYMVRNHGELDFLTIADLKTEFGEELPKLIYLFGMDDKAVFLLDPQAKTFAKDCERVERMDMAEALSLNEFREVRPMYKAFAGITAIQLYNWYRVRKFCGACGHEMEKSEKERAMVCPECGQIEYPKICPAVIIGVVDGDRIMMTKYAGREFTKYALIAGFCEIGESFEATVKREVMEEVGLKVKNVTYYASQPWSFSDTILAGFFCQLDGDDKPHMDEEELSLAEWMHRDDMPHRDQDVALTSAMMEAFRTKTYPMYEEWEVKGK